MRRALSWCEAHVNPFTQLLHYSPKGNAAVPFVENAYYALALFRSHQLEKGQKAKWLLGRLFAYQCENGAFPPYMHDWPHGSVRDEMRAPLVAIAERYGSIVGPRLDEVLKRLGGEPLSPPDLDGSHYQASTGAYIGGVAQEGFEPQLTVGELLINPNAARPDSAETLRTLLYEPPEVELLQDRVAYCDDRWVWGDAERIHTAQLVKNELFVDLHDCDIRVNGERATTFQLGDEVTIRSGDVTLAFTFHVDGEGDFMGHIARGNRPSQVLQEGTYDHLIFVRQLRGAPATPECRWRIP